MRVTSNMFPEAFKQKSNLLTSKQLQLHTQIATGLRVTKASEDPIAFQQAQQTIQFRARNKQYIENITDSRERVALVYQGMQDMSKSVSRALELTTKANDVFTQSDLQSLAAEMQGIINTVVSIANRQDSEGNFLFGGTANQRPIDPTTNLAAYADTDFSVTSNANLTSIEINVAVDLETTLVAGSPNGANAHDGFMINAAGNVNILESLKNIRDDLQAGNPVVDTPDTTNLRAGFEIVARFVGESATKLNTLELNEQAIQRQIISNEERIGQRLDVNMAEAISDLNKVQLHYEGALQSASRILSLSLLDFV